MALSFVCKRKYIFNFFNNARYLSSKRISNPYPVERPSVKEMDDEYKRFLQLKKKENPTPEFKITNIDINTFRKYKHKNNPTFSTEFKVFITGLSICAWCLFAMYMTVKIMTPNDFEWVDNERKRLEEAKKKIMSIKEKEKEFQNTNNNNNN
ncbi:conserved Plasmodium protein, unknown function [Plasmodium chabaudi chabaudi]|nr:conserved protein, unknown function [Plasmodium chabaudi chabaudi]SCL97732.1 conserved Plasmodium protein, unknown function [Plasmodium chabaudi chabaudi]SCL98057.1 conserved Plasmodium protein, unknown function [Plasmodium chabaudi chabaudi]VTZ67080.1 conserved protein, unknown function [Plasmodium chabaudi chabaudi]|eukprot:XP_016653227.1 conserved Plasmodium protein, unknown function [Plasmodium chabaudi chabaudi]